MRQVLVQHDAELEALVRGHLAEGALDRVGHVGEALVGDVQRHGARLDLGEIEDVVDQRKQLGARGVDGARELDLLRREVASGVVGEQLCDRIRRLLSGVRSSCDMLARNSDL